MQTTLQNSQLSAISCMLISAQHSIVLITSFLRMLYCLLTATPAGENGKKGAFQPRVSASLLLLDSHVFIIREIEHIVN
jgi:hypothetical protein